MPEPSPSLLCSSVRLGHHADDVRRQARFLVAAAEAPGWRSLAADRCRARLAAVAHDLLLLAGLLDRAGEAVADHAVTAARRAEALADAAGGLVGGAMGVALAEVTG